MVRSCVCPSCARQHGYGQGVRLRVRGRHALLWLLPHAMLPYNASTIFFFLLSSCFLASSLLPTTSLAAVVTEDGRETPNRESCNKSVPISEAISTPLVTLDNRGLPLYCWYHLKILPPLDWIIRIRFYKFKVGRLVNSTTCLDGYVSIRDGKEIGGSSPRTPIGYFCGEVDREQVYISETNDVTIIFHVESFSEATFISFESRGEQKFELHARYGSTPQLYPDRRGKLKQGSYCDRVFHDCRLGSCYIQSPGYPGIYPRNLKCRYEVATTSDYIKLYVENEEIDVDGQRCEDVILCPNRPVMNHCPYDYVNIHDGSTEQSPLIGSFCGRGKLPYAITGSGRHLLLVFVSSFAGPLLNIGFNFKAGPFSKWVGVGSTKINGTCDAIFHRENEIRSEERHFYSLATWYQPQTTCGFAIWGWETEIIRLHFKSFRIFRPSSAILDDRGCVETLTIYDAPFADEEKILAMFCDSLPPVMPRNQDFVSTGNSMFVKFRSEVGAYAGSSLDYWIQFDYFNAYTHGIPVQNTECDELFPSGGSTRGEFSSPLNSLLFARLTSLACTYSFLGTSLPFERVIVTLSSINFTGTSQCVSCLKDKVDKILIVDSFLDTTVSVPFISCLCGSRGRLLPRTPSPVRILSSGATLDVKLFVERDNDSTSPHRMRPLNTLLFQGMYEFLHGPRCGPPVLEARSQGELVFPNEEGQRTEESSFDDREDTYHMRCVWTLLVHPGKSLFLRFESLHLPGDCGVDRVEIKLPLRANEYADSSFVALCGGVSTVEDLPVVTASMLNAGRVLVEFRSSSPLEANFRLMWTELVQVEQHKEQSAAQAQLRDLNGCSFVCGGSNACIPHELVCNGVRNCPLAENDPSSSLSAFGSTYSSASDEDFQLCQSENDAINWLAIGLGVAGGGVLATSFIFIVHRCCRREHETDPG